MVVGKLGMELRLADKRDNQVILPRMMHVATENVQGVMGTHRGDPQLGPSA